MTPYEADKIISEARGECLHGWGYTRDDMLIWECVECGLIKQSHKPIEPKSKTYSDPTAWNDPELWQWIEGEGLHIEYTQLLAKDIEQHYRFSGPFYWIAMYMLSKATPEQKSLALARAIQERKGR